MRRFEPKETRFSNRVLLAHASAGLPPGLRLQARDGGKPAELLLYDEIGFWGITARDFASALRDVGDGDLVLRINSPGGEVFDGLAIYNSLRQHKGKVTAIVDGLAASAASFIALAASEVVMSETAFLMIHNSQGLAYGDRHTMAEMIGVMAKLDGQLANIYAGKTGKPAEELAALMDAETWFTSSEAVETGLADRVEEGLAVAARVPIKPGAFDHTPAALTDATDPAKLAAEADIARRRLLRLMEAEGSK